MPTATPPHTFWGDLVVYGEIRGNTIRPSTNSVGDNEVDSARPLSSSKTYKRDSHGYSQPNTAATTETRRLFTAYRDGTLLQFAAGSIAIAAGAATVTVDLKKNGVSVLTAVITLDTANTAYVLETGVFSSTAYVAGDTFTIVITATAGGGTLPTGVFVDLVKDEKPT